MHDDKNRDVLPFFQPAKDKAIREALHSEDPQFGFNLLKTPRIPEDFIQGRFNGIDKLRAQSWPLGLVPRRRLPLFFQSFLFEAARHG
jgi:hypothetical protein